MKKYISFFFILTMISCGSLDWSFFKNKKKTDRDKKVAQEFNLSEDVIAKFEAQKDPDDENEEKKKDLKKKPTDKKTASKNKTAKKEQHGKAQVKKGSSYPKDYPEKFIKLSASTKKHWSKLNKDIFTRTGETMFYEANYGGITMGKLIITNTGKETFSMGTVYEYKADIRTSPFYSYLYEMEGTISSHFLIDQLVPIKFRFDQVEHKKIRNDLQYYDFAELKTISLYKKEYRGKVKKEKKEAFIPFPYVDPFSIINFLRASELKIGSSYKIPLVHKGEILNFHIKVSSLKKIDTNLGQKEAYVVDVDANFTGETLKSGKLTFWIANDPTRALLQVKVKIKLGSVYLKLVEYKD